MNEKDSTTPIWRYVLIKEVDRIADRSLEPTLIYFIEKVFPEDYTKKQVIDEVKQRNIRWTETHKGVDFYFTRSLKRINLAKRRKNVWDIHTIGFTQKKDGKGLKTYTYYTSASIYESEAVAHAFGLQYWENQEDSYPAAGIITDLFANIHHRKSKSIKKIKKREEQSKNQKQPKILKKIPAYEGKEPFIFISYSHKDRSIIYPQIEWLNNEGIKVWYDEGIPPASIWDKIIPRKIVDSATMVIFLSKNAIESDNVSRELHYAVNHKIIVFPIYIEDTKLPDDFDFNLSNIQAIFKHQIPDNEYRRRVLKALENNLKN
jgi:hypothetical protein